MVQISVVTDDGDDGEDAPKNDAALTPNTATSAPEVPKALARKLGIVVRKASRQVVRRKVVLPNSTLVQPVVPNVVSNNAASLLVSPLPEEAKVAVIPVYQELGLLAQIVPQPESGSSATSQSSTAQSLPNASPDADLENPLLADPEIDKAVDQIVVNEGDELLAVDDSRAAQIAARP